MVSTIADGHAAIPTVLWLLPCVALPAGVLGTWLMMCYARQHSLLDIPNNRSLHDRPVPRGGGLAVAVIILLSLPILLLGSAIDVAVFSALLPPAVLVLAIGWLDDHYQLPVVQRGAGYLAAATWFVIFHDQLPVLSLDIIFHIDIVDRMPRLMAGLISLAVILGIAWFTNLYNFMDGADGLAGLQALLAGVSGGWLFWMQGAEGLALLSAVIALATAGFLYWNWPPARIFMGDVGSCLLGFMFACLALLGEHLAGLPALMWIILLAVFVWDATLTLLMRMFRGDRWYSAHRCHAYQRLVQSGLSQRGLAWSFLAYNLIVLWPLAFWAYYQPEHTFIAVIAASIVTALIWLTIQVYYSRTHTGNNGRVQD